MFAKEPPNPLAKLSLQDIYRLTGEAAQRQKGCCGLPSCRATLRAGQVVIASPMTISIYQPPIAYCRRHLPPSCLPPSTLLYRSAAAGLLRESLGAPPRQHNVLRLEDLAAWTSDGDPETLETVTWCGFEQVVAVLDDDVLRKSTVTWPLQIHPKFSIARVVGRNAGWVEHRQLVQWIRSNFRDEVGPDFLAQISSIQVRSKSDGHSVAKHGQDSFGKSIDAEVIGAGGLPETIGLTLPVWVGLDHTESIQFELQVDAADAKFRFAPVAGEMEEAIDTAVRWLTDEVEKACSGRVIAGTP